MDMTLGKKITLAESKAIQLELMKKIHDVCERHGLKYSLMFGTLLGAVRHQGFIPWDDDLDICMPREDYEAFFKIYSQENIPNTQAVNCWNDPKYYLPFGKVIDTRTVMKENVSLDYTMGVYVDIFPVDRLSADPAENAKLRKKILFWRKLMMIKFNPGSNMRKGLKKAAHTVLNKLPLQFNVNALARKIDKVAQTFSACGEGNLAMVSNLDFYGIAREYDPDLFANLELCKFEDQMFLTPVQRDTLLTQIYGNYMQLPPEDKRLPHENDAWWKKENMGE